MLKEYILPEVKERSAKKNLMEYKGYVGKIEYDPETRLFYGEVINLRDVITFYGASVEELERDLADSVEDYLEFCKERGEKPEKPFSGRFVVRIDPELHRKLYIVAKEEDVSINQLVTSYLEKCLEYEYA